jgi:superkiller protein 3
MVGRAVTETTLMPDEESKERAHDWFVASLRCLESFAPAFTSLGIYYSSTQDEDRAIKCFQRAFELDATETEAAHKLASLYADQEQWEQVRAIASRVMEGEGGLEGAADGEKLAGKSRFAPKNGWAWKAMGAVEVVRTCPQPN